MFCCYVFPFSKQANISEATPSANTSISNEGFVLSLPGDLLDMSTLVNKRKKIRNRGGRDAAMAAMKNLCRRQRVGQIYTEKKNQKKKI